MTRALETASYVSCATGLPLRVEPLLHEWQVYESGTDNFEKARTMFLENEGSYFLIVLFNMRQLRR